MTAHLHPREAGGGSDRKQENQWSEKKTVSALLQTEHNPEEAQTRAAELSNARPPKTISGCQWFSFTFLLSCRMTHGACTVYK